MIPFELQANPVMRRRAFLGRRASSLRIIALNLLLRPILFGAMSIPSCGAVNPLDFPPKAKRVIFLYQAGGPSLLETFDFKPKLAEMDGKAMPESFTKGQQI